MTQVREVEGICKIVQNRTDVILVVQHNDVIKYSVRPLSLYHDSEVGVLNIAENIAKIYNATVVINRTGIDTNEERHLYPEWQEKVQRFYRVIDRMNPKLILDLHGCADRGVLFAGTTNNDARLYREQAEKKIAGPRPDIDIEFRRKSASKAITANGATVEMLAKHLIRYGFIVDFEAVFPGGNLIGTLRRPQRQCIALEIARRIRTTEDKKEKLIHAIGQFIKEFRGENVNYNVIDTAGDIEEFMRRNDTNNNLYM